MARGKLSTVVVVIGVVMTAWTASTQAQTTPQQMPCIESLLPCAEFLNSTKPPATCCGPLMAAFKTQLQCLCDVFQNPAVAATMNVNVTQALQLPKNCGLDADPTTACSNAPKTPKAHSPEAASTPTAAPSLPKPAPSPGNSAASTAPVSGLVLILVGFMFH
ncbi:hypothetical protein Cgig2_011820 [Carnegiea gigantea]|uniref:Bifunctional inhibitor/plant lipid transfer protein/seed storage helical domain-containing protein n=1 Tax=Carnegiea gigantea TaxID=171969 RepID=A0A9Q1JXA1_9CARY|nr:hypothetical protein Cgig2_011820 [Carnegiea gigantea]